MSTGLAPGLATGASGEAAPAVSSMRRAFRSIGKLGIACLVVIALTVLVAIFSPLLTPDNPNLGQIGEVYLGISSNHLLGTDGQGYDIFSRLMAGSRTTARAAGRRVHGDRDRHHPGDARRLVPGFVDTGISAMTNVLFAFPGMIGDPRRHRAGTESHRGRARADDRLHAGGHPRAAQRRRHGARADLHLSALEIQGYSSFTICIRHLIPNMSALIAAEFTLLFGFSMVDLSAISYLGLGTQPPASDWGVMVAEGQNGILAGHPGEALAAGITIFVIVLAFTLLGERIAGLGGVDYRSTGIMAVDAQPAAADRGHRGGRAGGERMSTLLARGSEPIGAAASRRLPAVDPHWRLADGRGRPGARHRRRVRLRQVDDRARHRASVASSRRDRRDR